MTPGKLERAAKRFELTEKQRDICLLIGLGNTYKAAADALGISKMAVYFRVRCVLQKTKSVSMAEVFFRLGLA